MTLVKDRKKNLPFKKENYDRVRLVFFGEDETPDGSLKELVKKALQKEGLETEEYAPNGAGLTGPAKLDKRLLTLYISNFEAKANRTAVRLDWGMNYTPVTPRHPKEADYAFLSFANPYHLADVPRMPVYVNAYTASRFTVEAAIGSFWAVGVSGGKPCGSLLRPYGYEIIKRIPSCGIFACGGACKRHFRAAAVFPVFPKRTCVLIPVAI